MRGKFTFQLITAIAGLLVLQTGAWANGLIVSTNGFSQIGINDDGSLDAVVTGTTSNITNGGLPYVGIGYNFTGQGDPSRTGFLDALSPGCPCESWGVAATDSTSTTFSGQVGQTTGNQNIGVNNSSAGTNDNSSAGPTATFTSNTFLTTLPLLTVTQAFSTADQTTTGGLFQDTVTITNGTGGTLTNVQFARAMDWDVPPTEFNEYVTFKGTTTTSTLIRSTDNGFANANPTLAVSDPGLIGPVNADGTTGPTDHGSLFVFDFGSLAAGASYTFDIFYGSGADETDALALLSSVSPELYSLGESSYISGGGSGGPQRTDLPTYIFAFNGVGGSVVVPPEGVPEPGSLALIAAALLGFGVLRRRFG